MWTEASIQKQINTSPLPGNCSGHNWEKERVSSVFRIFYLLFWKSVFANLVESTVSPDTPRGISVGWSAALHKLHQPRDFSFTECCCKGSLLEEISKFTWEANSTLIYTEGDYLGVCNCGTSYFEDRCEICISGIIALAFFSLEVARRQPECFRFWWRQIWVEVPWTNAFSFRLVGEICSRVYLEVLRLQKRGQVLKQQWASGTWNK